MQVSVSILSIYDSYVENIKQKILIRLDKSIHSSRTKYAPQNAKLDLCISLISKIYNINKKILKDRDLAVKDSLNNENYREASGMLYFILLNDLNWSWKDIIENFKTNNHAIHTYVSKFQESKNKATKEKYLYVIDKMNEAFPF